MIFDDLNLPGCVSRGNTLCGAIFSPCRNYRYALWRSWSDDAAQTAVAFIGVNPSKADETINDRTINRCIDFAARWGHGGLVMLNLFGWRETYPEIMREVDEPIGEANDAVIIHAARRCNRMIAAWGVNGTHRGRDVMTLALSVDDTNLLRDRLECLGTTDDGMPRHPLYVPGATLPKRYECSIPTDLWNCAVACYRLRHSGADERIVALAKRECQCDSDDQAVIAQGLAELTSARILDWRRGSKPKRKPARQK